MSKKSNNNTTCQGKDVLERMNFLYQAGNLMAEKNPVLACYYGQLCKSVAKKAVLRMEPSIKRTICKRCGNILKPATTADIEIDEKNQNFCVIICLKCKTTKRFMINERYQLWLDNPDSIKETLSIQCTTKNNENPQNFFK